MSDSTSKRNGKLHGKVALITGAAQGIGRAIAIEFAREGADIVINDYNNIEKSTQVVHEIESLGQRSTFFNVDVSKREDVAGMFEKSVEKFGHVDIVVANAYHSVREPLLTCDWNNVLRSVEVTQFGTFHVCQLGAKEMTKRNLGGGKILIIGSILSELSWPGNIPYSMAKAAISHMAEIMSLELAAYKINVNVINPGWIDTPGERKYASDEEIQKGAQRIPLGRLGIPEDIAKAALFLCSSDANYITGTILRVDGGMVPGQTFPEKSPVYSTDWMNSFLPKKNN